ncbi:MAG: M48 family metallopeptidase [Metamycoplasmataceae bacterium]
MILQFNYNDEIIEVTVTKKRIRNIYIKLDSNNNIVVSSPKASTNKYIINFVNQHLEKFVKLQKKNSIKSHLDLRTQTFYLFGWLESYELVKKVNKDNEIINYLVFRNKKHKIGKKSISDIIYSIYKKELLLYLKSAQYYKEQLMNVEHHEISVKMKKSAWASNYIEKKKINYSTKLAAYSRDTIDYVIVHELAHAEHTNHSKEFWNKVEKYEPDFKVKKNKLKSFIYF